MGSHLSHPHEQYHETNQNFKLGVYGVLILVLEIPILYIIVYYCIIVLLYIIVYYTPR